MRDIEIGGKENGKALRSMLAEALHGEETITWRHITDALRNPTVDELVQAQKLELDIQRKDDKQEILTLDTTGTIILL